MGYGEFAKFLFAFKGVIGQFWPGFEVQNGTTVVLEDAKFVRFTEEFDISVDPNNEQRAIIELSSVDGGTF